MKKSNVIISVAIFFALFALIFSGAQAFAAKKPKSESKKLKIVATIFPEYDWTREILGERAADAELTLLLDNGVDLHSFQPSMKDIIKVGAADVFIFVGGESDEWIEDALKNATNKNQKTVNLLEILGERAKTEEIVEGMESSDEDEDEKDEHVWLSIKNAPILCEAICNAICEADAENAHVYQKNLALYTKKLSELDAEYEKTILNASKKTLLFADRFPFRYLVDDYGLSYFAAFSGCSSETEASFKTVVFLSGKIDELNLGTICTIEKCDQKLAKSVIQNSKKKKANIAEIDSMQATTLRDAKKGATYIKIMKKNLAAIKNALR